MTAPVEWDQRILVATTENESWKSPVSLNFSYGEEEDERCAHICENPLISSCTTEGIRRARAVARETRPGSQVSFKLYF